MSQARQTVGLAAKRAFLGTPMQTRISAPERPVDLGLREPFLPVIGDIEQPCALKMRKTQLTAAASHKVPDLAVDGNPTPQSLAFFSCCACLSFSMSAGVSLGRSIASVIFSILPVNAN